MSRTDMYLDAMLRHLGAAYYESLHGRATSADVTRALDSVEEHLNEQASRSASGNPAGSGRPRHGGWARKVSDVMTTSVVTVDRITPYKEMARLMTENRISGLPVLKMGREVVGVVTEADLVAAEVKTARRLRSRPAWRAWPPWRTRRQPHPALTAGELMTAPAITIGPGATVPAAARLMDTHHIRRLPVVDKAGKLVGIVSRRDLLGVFLRPDEEIAADVRRILDEFLPADADDVDVTVHNGIVTLAGTVDDVTGRHADVIPLAIRLMWGVDGVVDIIDRLSLAQPGSASVSQQP